ncbi:uncharacterized protein CANTADRAFT_52906 [Suhomyces tanzawaensis NRRL Y-17324]|uniref:Alcohol acetyltransferase n=1 Tax=Suhomyces tanzawaensis NRRL Y-17324 TaxID=984487 RepID=A0A1E4SH82_9ASCO|nr:uncharacterized protein CANTADRAFT_52906 [Suhomyces tanzawaensis NRRL Y-17324]ODV78830.1 hypothetical protein CANTADRAFT_52906 [Suhomyces tanzawaensis NRRL Y-17324]
MPQLTRDADFIERCAIYRTILAKYTNYNLTVKFGSPVTAEVLSSALKSLMRKHVFLTYNFQKTGSKPFTETLGHDYQLVTPQYIRFEDVVSFEKIDKLDGHFLGKINKICIPSNLPNHPLWRIKVLELANGEQHLMVIFDHALTDGESGSQFLSDLANELSDVTSETYEEYIFDLKRDADVVPEKPTPSSESLGMFKVPFPMRMVLNCLPVIMFLGKASAYVRSFFPYHQIKANYNVNPLFEVKFGPDQGMNAGFFSIDNSKLEVILKKCRSQGLTLTPYINTIAISVLEEVVYPCISKKNWASNFTLAMSARRFLDPSPKFQYGNISTFDRIELSPVKNNELNVMKYISNAIKHQIDTKMKGGLAFLGMIKYWSVFKVFELMLGGPRTTFVMSNLRVMDETHGKYKILDVIFNQSGTGHYFGINVISTQVGGLSVTVNWDDEFDKIHEDKRQIMDIFLEKFEERLLNFEI